MKRKNLKITTISLSIALALSMGAGAICLHSSRVIAETVEPYAYFRSDNTITVTENYTGGKGTGVQVTLDTKGSSTASFEYQNYIKTSDLDNFLTMGFEPLTVGKTDFDYVTVTLTDALDSDNQLVYAIGPQAETSRWWSAFTHAWIALTDDLVPKVKTEYGNATILNIENTKQNIIGKNIGQTPAPESPYYRGPYSDGGLIIGDKTAYFQKSTAETKLNTISFGLVGGISAKIAGKEVAALTDSDWLNLSSENLAGTALAEKYTKTYIENLFSSGYVSLSVEFINITSDSVSCYMTQIGDQSFADNSGKIKDSEPYIGAGITTNAIVGKAYTLPECSSKNFRDGDLTQNVTVSVKNLATQNTVPVQNGEVTFTEAGNYKIVYSVKDGRNNTFEKSYEITCFDKTPKTTFTYRADFNESYTTGETINIPAVKAYSDLSRKADGSVSATALIQKDGKIIEAYEDLSNSIAYTLKEAGNYSIVFIYQDEFGNIQSTSEHFTVTAVVMIKESKLPVTFTAGKSIELSDFVVESYLSGVDTENVYRAIYIGDKQLYLAKGETVISGSLTLAADTFTEKGNAKLIYKAGTTQDNLTYSKTFDIPVIKPVYISDYISPLNESGVFDDTNLSVIHTMESSTFVSSTDKTFLLPQYLPSDELEISFGANSEYANFESLSVKLKNGLTGKSVIIDISKDTSKTAILNINGTLYTVNGSLTNGANFFKWIIRYLSSSKFLTSK